MTYVYREFVNRKKALDALRSMARLETEDRILVIHGRQGMGKTSLFKHFREKCLRGDEDIACALFDFAELPDGSYWGIILGIEEQLGPAGFEHLEQVIAETIELESRSVAAAESVMPKPGGSTMDPAAAGGRSGDVDFHGPTTVYGDVVRGHQFITIIQLSRSAEPPIQRLIRSRVTDALRDCLVALSATRPMAILFDSWHEAPEDTRRWLKKDLLSWIVREQLPRTVAAITCNEVPDLDPVPTRAPQFLLTGLCRAAVERYWVNKRHLPSDGVDDVMKYGGIPNVMITLADACDPRLKASAGGGNLP